MKFIANERARQLKENFGMEKAGVYDPQSIGGTHVIYVLHDATDPERYGGLPKNPTIPWSYTIWKWLFKPVLGTFALFGGLGVLLHYVAAGPRRAQPEHAEKEAATWERRLIASTRRRGELLIRSDARKCIRASCCDIRFTHGCCTGWSRLFFFLALFSGFGIYLPWLFRWFTPVFGGGPLSRQMHPWFGVGFVFSFSYKC